ncbi:MAG: hypothetical protein J0I17_05555 ['Candidatus Kapabacteria' thiocyanatum]|uniref:Uncharacterized protein n=1 Tax=Candidatus Kapaibacterium thiocyanatum TaxID=1895771 RepID=A0A1M3L557_9BACT|nr:hypothetical protein ['Candidatus Kapabacteria' thiocyanatum]OJX60692.1 MAG: hypothetical protein BGO89_03715 ['Candidatus Kapabacteria' thiocyanatum]
MNNVRTYDSVVARYVLGLILVALFPMHESSALTDSVWYHFKAGSMAFTTSKARWSTNVPTPTAFRKFLAISGSRKRYAGPFGNQHVRITLDSLPPHGRLVVEALVYILGSWDGNADGDRLSIVVDGRDTLLHSTFSNTTWAQSYPRGVGRAANPRWSGAADTNVTGFRFTEANVYDGPLDAGYRLRFVVPHDRDSAIIDFIGVLKDVRPTTDNEAWGIASLRITPEGGPPPGIELTDTVRNDGERSLAGDGRKVDDDLVLLSCFDPYAERRSFAVSIDTAGWVRLWNDRRRTHDPVLYVRLEDAERAALGEAIDKVMHDATTIDKPDHGICSIVIGGRSMDFGGVRTPSLQRIHDVIDRTLRNNGWIVIP